MLQSAKLCHEMKQCASAICKPAFHSDTSRYRAVDTQCYLHHSTGRTLRTLYQTTGCASQHVASSQACGPTFGHTAGGAEHSTVRVLPPAQCQRTFSPELHDILYSVALNVLRLRPLVLLVTAALRYKLLWSNGGMILTGGNRSSRRAT